MRYLVTGGCGSIGSALIKSLLSSGHTVCCYDINEEKLFYQNNEHLCEYPTTYKPFLGDVRDLSRLERAFRQVDRVFHCAALKHVSISEYNPFEFLKTNVEGTHNVVEACLNTGVQRLVFASSDKAVNPSSTMGATKLLAERIVTSSASYRGASDFKAACVRFGNVWNTNGSVVQTFHRLSLAKLPLTVTSRYMSRFFVSIEEAIDLCKHAMTNMNGGEVIIQNMGVMNIFNLANAFNVFFQNPAPIEISQPLPGEKLYEELFTECESLRACLSGGYYVIPNEISTVPDSSHHTLKPLRSDDAELKQIDFSTLISRL
jgi:UDP-N-acetylglucosamine 4,6-dehydratase/5-epimerase